LLYFRFYIIVFTLQHHLETIRIYLDGPVYTGCPKKVGTPEYLGKYKFYRKVFQIKVVEFKRTYLLILLVWPWVALPIRSKSSIF